MIMPFTSRFRLIKTFLEFHTNRPRMGGGFSGPQTTGRGGAIASSRQSFAEMAAGGNGSSALLNDAFSTPKSYSWLQRDDDVSADDLINYIQSVIGSTQGDAAAPDADLSTPLADAQPFGYSDEAPTDDLDLIVSGDKAKDVIMTYADDANDRDKKVLVCFRAGDHYISTYEIKKGDRAGQMGTVLKGRLLKVL